MAFIFHPEPKKKGKVFFSLESGMRRRGIRKEWKGVGGDGGEGEEGKKGMWREEEDREEEKRSWGRDFHRLRFFLLCVYLDVEKNERKEVGLAFPSTKGSEKG